MTSEEDVTIPPTCNAEYKYDYQQQTYQTNFYEMTRTYPPINLLLQNI